MFRAININKDGVLSLGELHCKLSDMGMSDDQIEKLMYTLDTDRSDTVDMTEWIDGYEHVGLTVTARLRARWRERAQFGDLVGPNGGPFGDLVGGFTTLRNVQLSWHSWSYTHQFLYNKKRQ